MRGSYNGQCRGGPGSMKLLDISDLRVTFRNPAGNVRALDSVDLSLNAGDSSALVGESGCGKTVLGMAVMGLLPSNATVSVARSCTRGQTCRRWKIRKSGGSGEGRSG